MKNHTFSTFDVSLVRLMTSLYNNDAITDEIMDIICELDFEYQSLYHSKLHLEEKSPIDPKTQLLKESKEHFLTILKSVSRTLDRSLEELFNISIIRFDIDNMARINNHYGSDRGEIIALDVAGILMKNSRPTDFVIINKSETFDAILPTTNIKGAVTYAEKIFSLLHTRRYEFENESIDVTISAGVTSASYPSKQLKSYTKSKAHEEYQRLIKQANHALTDARKSGGNTFKIYDEKKAQIKNNAKSSK